MVRFGFARVVVFGCVVVCFFFVASIVVVFNSVVHFAFNDG